MGIFYGTGRALLPHVHQFLFKNMKLVLEYNIPTESGGKILTYCFNYSNIKDAHKDFKKAYTESKFSDFEFLGQPHWKNNLSKKNYLTDEFKIKFSGYLPPKISTLEEWFDKHCLNSINDNNS